MIMINFHRENQQYFEIESDTSENYNICQKKVIKPKGRHLNKTFYEEHNHTFFLYSTKKIKHLIIYNLKTI